MQYDPTPTALLFTTVAVLVGVSVLFSRASERLNVPLTLVFLLIGVAAGSEGLLGIPFDDYELAFHLGTAALVLILFDGGLSTSNVVLRQAAGPAMVLSTVAVVGTAAIMTLLARLLGLPWPYALLLGAIVSSTDAASVFAVLRSSGIQLQRRVGATLEVESGTNDPMAIILTTLLIQNILDSAPLSALTVVTHVGWQLLMGAVAGLVVGYAGSQILQRFRPPAGGLFPVFTLAMAFFAYGTATLAAGNGFLATYVAAVVLGNGKLPYRTGLTRAHDALAWLSQVTMFLVLGLLVYPSRLMNVALVGMGLSLLLTFVARPLIVWICLLPFRFPRRDVAYISWVGLRGAVPIILATLPVIAGVPGAETLFDLVFFIVLMNALIPGATVPWVTRRMGLESGEPPPPPAVLEIESMQPLEGQLQSFYIDDALAVCGSALADLPFPDGSAVTMIVRGKELIAPRGTTTLQPGDHVYVLSHAPDMPLIRLMFGRPEEA